MKLDGRKMAMVACILAIPSFAVYLGAGEALRSSEKPSEYIAVIISVLAASLFATISIVGDPGNLMRGSWRSAWEEVKPIQLRLMKLTYLFILYLVVLAFLVLSEIVESKKLETWYWIHSVFAWLTILAFIGSLWLPFEIKNIQISRLEREIQNKKSGGNQLQK